MKYSQRISYIDIGSILEHIVERLAYVEKLKGMLAAEPNRLRRTRLFSLAIDCGRSGFMRYAIGFEVHEYRELLVAALRACVEAFQVSRNGEGSGFKIVDMVVDPSIPKGEAGRVTLRDRYVSSGRDHSMTNSKDAFWYVCLGFGLGEDGLARELAKMIWDPPDADYIGKDSTVCTPNEQAIAYGMKAFLEGDRDTALKEVNRVRALPDNYVGCQAQLFKALVQRDRTAFLKAMEALLVRHEKASRRDKWNSSLYICASACGLTALAIQEGLISKEEVPSSMYLPLDMRVEKIGASCRTCGDLPGVERPEGVKGV